MVVVLTGDDDGWCVKVLELAASIAKQIPENIDYETTVQVLSVDPCPLNVVLLQEVLLT